MKRITLTRHRQRFTWEGIQVRVTEVFTDDGQSSSDWNIDLYQVGERGVFGDTWRGSATWLPATQSIARRGTTGLVLSDDALVLLAGQIITREWLTEDEPFDLEEPGDRCGECGRLKAGAR